MRTTRVLFAFTSLSLFSSACGDDAGGTSDSADTGAPAPDGADGTTSPTDATAATDTATTEDTVSPNDTATQDSASPTDTAGSTDTATGDTADPTDTATDTVACTCVNGTCAPGQSACEHCDEGWAGAACDVACPSCGYGQCFDDVAGSGSCLCDPGFAGASCRQCQPIGGAPAIICDGQCIRMPMPPLPSNMKNSGTVSASVKSTALIRQQVIGVPNGDFVINTISIMLPPLPLSYRVRVESVLGVIESPEVVAEGPGPSGPPGPTQFRLDAPMEGGLPFTFELVFEGEREIPTINGAYAGALELFTAAGSAVDEPSKDLSFNVAAMVCSN